MSRDPRFRKMLNAPDDADTWELMEEVGYSPEEIQRIKSSTARLARAFGKLVDHLRDQVDTEFGAGTFKELGDSWQALLFRGSPEEFESVVNLLAPRLRLRLRGRDPATLMDRAEKAGHAAREESTRLARAGLMAAATDMERSQAIKLRDNSWVVDGEGQITLVRPSDLAPSEALSWYIRTARKAAKWELRGQPWPSGDELWSAEDPKTPPEPKEPLDSLTLPLEDAIFRDDVVRTPMDDMIFAEDTALVERVLARLPEKQRELAITRGSTTETWEETRVRLGLNKEAMKSLRRRLDENLQRLFRELRAPPPE